MRKQEYICKNPHIFVINLLFAKYVLKLQKKKKKSQRTLFFRKGEILPV